MRTANRHHNGLSKTAMAVLTMILFLSLLGMVVWAPAEAKSTPPENVGPVYSKSEALEACKAYSEWPEMEMDCRQAAWDTKWPENADNIDYPL